jgi:hypothetical protein
MEIRIDEHDKLWLSENFMGGVCLPTDRNREFDCGAVGLPLISDIPADLKSTILTKVHLSRNLNTCYKKTNTRKPTSS